MTADDRSSLDSLGKRIAAARGGSETEQATKSSATGATSMRQAAQAYRIFLELLAGVLLGAGIGWFVDRSFGTEPWGLLVMVVLGLAAGVNAMLRTIRSMERNMSETKQD
jgi:ATP synthase protein I